jgi:hypothetical protein
VSNSFINVTEGSGKRLNADQKTIDGLTVYDEYVLPGEYNQPSFVAHTIQSLATANDHVLALWAGASLKVRIRRIYLEQSADSASATIGSFQINRLTTAGSGGTGVTPRPFDTADTATATAIGLPSSKGTEGVTLFNPRIHVRSAAHTNGAEGDSWEWVQHPGLKPLIIPAGTANGICIKTTASYGTASLSVTIEFAETTF